MLWNLVYYTQVTFSVTFQRKRSKVKNIFCIPLKPLIYLHFRGFDTDQEQPNLAEM